jgi:HSP20 family protein
MALELWRPKRALARRSPARDLIREMEDVFDRFFRDWSFPWSAGESRGWAPPVDMIDRNNEVVVRVDVPGLTEKDVHVTVDNGVLTISGQRQGERESTDEDYYYAERWAGSFSRSLMLPSGVDADGIKATLKHGTLEVHLPKTKEAAGKVIEVKAA